MSPITSFKAFAALLSAAVSTVCFAALMALTGSRPLPVSCLVATTGAAIGYWRSGRLAARPRPLRHPSKEPST